MSLNGYYDISTQPDAPMAWGVSSYNKFYNWLWFGNGYHAEHHYPPRLHWTKMHQFHEDKRRTKKAGVHTITCHALGFLAKENQECSRMKVAVSASKPRLLSCLSTNFICARRRVRMGIDAVVNAWRQKPT